MDILNLTNNRFREGVAVKVLIVDSLSTMWVRIAERPKISYTLNSEMENHPTKYLPKANSLIRGMYVAALTRFKDRYVWERAVILQRTMKGYRVYLVDWGFQNELSLDMIRLLPKNLQKMAPWVRKIVLPGVRDQPTETRHRAAQYSMLEKTGILVDVDPSPGEAITARLLLDWETGESPRDMGAHWLELGYIDP
ncbi:uncharacterized protein [Bombus fervidus]|uniref:uncharacterized protein n=1 Tax=Bombus fervidus TaxID=203811 RepID=UPI003D18D22E